MCLTIQNLLFVFSLTSLSIVTSKSQDVIYGSNNGSYAEVLGRQIYYEVYGVGTPLIMLHGGPGSIADFRKVIPELSKHFRVVALDSPGQGRSEKADSLSYQLLADNASAFIEKLGINKCYVVGFSDGAVTALLLAVNRPNKVKKVFTSGGFSNINGFTAEVKTLWSTITPEFVEKSWGSWHTEYQKLLHPKNDWRKLIYDIRDMVNEKTYISQNQLEKINCNVLLAYGDQDGIFLEHALELHRGIKHSELMIVPGTGHSTFEEKPYFMSQAVISFFTKSE